MQVVVALKEWGVRRDYERLEEGAWTGRRVEPDRVAYVDKETSKQS